MVCRWLDPRLRKAHEQRGVAQHEEAAGEGDHGRDRTRGGVRAVERSEDHLVHREDRDVKSQLLPFKELSRAL